MNQNEAIQFFEGKLGLKFHPAGEWEWDSNSQKKIPKKVNVSIGSKWKPSYNMGKIVLENGITPYLVVDIDGDSSLSINKDSITFTINGQEIELPLTFYTQTTKEGKYHFWYRIDPLNNLLPSRATTSIKENIDLFTNGIIFEWHSFSPHHKIFDHPIADLPKDVIFPLDDKKQTEERLLITPNLSRANIVKLFLKNPEFLVNEKPSQKLLNQFFRLVFPKEVLPNKKHIKWRDFTISHDLINSIAVKLTTTSQLDTFKHVIPAIHLIVENLVDRYDKAQTQRHIENHILPGLPQHQEILDYDDEEILSLEEALSKQHGRVKLVRTIVNGDLRYVRVDGISFRPIPVEGVRSTTSGLGYYMTKTTARKLHPELAYTDENGRPQWDDSLLPDVTLIRDIYKPQSFLDEHDRLVLNSYTPSKYYQEVTPRTSEPDNIYSRAIRATIGSKGILFDYQTGEEMDATLFYHYFMAYTMFADLPPKIRLWMATAQSVRGGAGKSMAGIDFPAKVMGSVVVQQTMQNIRSGWGDAVTNARLVSLEDLEKPDQRSFQDFYGSLKRLTTHSVTRQNMKGRQFVDVQIKMAMTISSNWIPPIPEADRYIVALEPAWLHGLEENISLQEQIEIAKRISSQEYDEEAQEVVNYWYGLFIEDQKKPESERPFWMSLYEFAPKSRFRPKWITADRTPTKSIIPTLPVPEEFKALIKEDIFHEVRLVDLMRFLIANYHLKTGKVGLPWNWFIHLFPYVMSDDYSDKHWSKKTVANALDVEFKTNMGSLYYEAWQGNPDWFNKYGIDIPEATKWKVSGITIDIEPEAIEEYKGWVVELDSTNNLKLD